MQIHRKNGRSILHNLSATVLSMVIALIVILVIALIASKVIPNLTSGSYENFAQNTSNRISYVENEMYNRWTAIDSFIPRFVDDFPDEISDEKKMSDSQVLTYFENNISTLITMLRDTKTTGSFIILNDNNADTQTHSCLYLTDGDPYYNDLQNNSDLQMLKGPWEFLNQYKIPLHMSWNYGLTLSQDNEDMFYKPFNAAQSIKEYEHLGYWHISKSLYDKNASVITYTMPLVSKTGYVFGVVGIEISQDYLYKMLPKDELSSNKFSGYALAQQDKQGNMVSKIVSSDARSILPQNQPISLSEIDKQNECYSLATNNKSKIVAHLEPIKLYDNNTPFDDVSWFFLGMADQDVLLEHTVQLERALLFAIAFAILFGLLVSVAIGNHFAKPIKELVRRIRALAPQEHIILDKIGVTEIDALSGAIEQLNENVLNSVIKTDKIISMVNIDIGSFEYTLDGNFVTISDTLAKMFKLQPDSKNYIDKSEFLKKLASIQEHKTSPNIYQYGSTPPKWVKIEAVETDSGVFGIAVDVTKDELTKRSIMMERDYDILTGIYSRFAFQRELNLLFENITFSHAAFMMSDLDNLKYINDTYGHDIGDAYIKSVASLLSRYFSDKNALYARMSGDEFYLFIYGYESDDEIRTILHDFYSLLNSEYVVLPDKTKFRLKMSSGVSWYNKDSCTPEELLRFADFAMYEVKRSVKGAIREFNKTGYSNDSYLLTGKEELYTILDEQFMDYEFQPIICVDDGSTYGYEALMRPHGKNINSPDRLLHLAKAQGQLWRIEKNTFYRVLELYKTSSNLFGNAKLFINSVPNQTLKDSEYAELERLYGDFLSNVVIEITESEKIDDFPLGRKKQLVSKWNAMLALDDYGSGYANDMLLLSLQPNIIKIDQFLIVDIEQSKDKQALITQIVSFAKDRNILVLAEGVETKEQFVALKKLGVSLIQGFFTGRPCSLDKIDPSKAKKIVEEINM